MANRKFASYYRYINGHKKLFDCTNNKECADAARDIVLGKFENDLAWKELNYYKENGDILGEHPIWEEFNAIRQIRQSSVQDLLIKYENLYKDLPRSKKKYEKEKDAAKKEKFKFDYEKKLKLYAECERIMHDRQLDKLIKQRRV